MHSVLMLCYSFPPLAGGGVQRSAKFVKYLPRYGWQPLVVAARGRLLSQRFGLDHTLAHDVAGAKVWRLGEWQIRPSLEAAANLLLGDDSGPETDWLSRQAGRLRRALVDLTEKGLRWNQFNPWVLNAVLLGLRLVRKYGVCAIYSSQPPIYAHVAGYFLSRLTHLPWVADYRDPYTSRPDWQPGPRWYARHLLRLDSKMVRQATRVVSVGTMLTEDMIRRFPEQPPGKFVTIRNGYDPPDLAVTPQPSRGTITIVHAGAVRPIDRDPSAFLRAVARLAGTDGIIPQLGKISVTFIGAHNIAVQSTATRLGLDGLVHFEPRVDHKTCVARLLGSDLILVLNGSSRNKYSDRILTGKLYEVLGTGRPALVLTPDTSEAAALCRHVGGCWLAAPDDETAILRCLTDWANRIRRGSLPVRDSSALASITREGATRQLAQLLDLAMNGYDAQPRCNGH
ncbi:MAG: hypothetical protein IMZ62_18785 [Chloroflexi bacterium]|nr:hypothetical protein [Chloroflexota bacterium]